MCGHWRALLLAALFFAGDPATARAQSAAVAPGWIAPRRAQSAGEPQPVQQQTDPGWRWGPLTVGGDVALTSAFVWRGFVLHDGACLQPDVWLELSDFTVTSWLNIRRSIPDDSHLNEHDFSVDYARSAGRITLSAGWTNYRFFGREDGHTSELYAGASAEVLLQPGVTVYKDIQMGSGTYVSVSAAHRWPMGGRATAGAQVAFGYNNHLYIDGAGLSDVAVTLSVSLPVPSARLLLEPRVTYSHSLMPDTFPSRLFGGLSVAFR
jgi:hypothetical protein